MNSVYSLENHKKKNKTDIEYYHKLINRILLFSSIAFFMSFSSYLIFGFDKFIKFGIFLIKNGYSIIIMTFHLSSKKELNITGYIYESIKNNIDLSENKFLIKIIKYNMISDFNLLKKVHIAIGILLHCNIICNGFLIQTINITYGC